MTTALARDRMLRGVDETSRFLVIAGIRTTCTRPVTLRRSSCCTAHRVRRRDVGTGSAPPRRAVPGRRSGPAGLGESAPVARLDGASFVGWLVALLVNPHGGPGRAGMNCISPCAPELVWLLRPCPVSSIPMPASSVQGILYWSAAARYSFLIFGGIGSGGLFSEARRGVPVVFELFG
jgi:hypothetical protein